MTSNERHLLQVEMVVSNVLVQYNLSISSMQLPFHFPNRSPTSILQTFATKGMKTRLNRCKNALKCCSQCPERRALNRRCRDNAMLNPITLVMRPPSSR